MSSTSEPSRASRRGLFKRPSGFRVGHLVDDGLLAPSATAVAAEVTGDATEGKGRVPETLPVHAYPSAVATLDEIGEGLVYVVFAEQNGLNHLLALSR